MLQRFLSKLVYKWKDNFWCSWHIWKLWLKKFTHLSKFTYCKQIGCFSLSSTSVPLTFFLNIGKASLHNSKRPLIFSQPSLWLGATSCENRWVSSFDNSKKLSAGAPFSSRLLVNHYGWMASKQYRFVPPIYQWFSETVASLKERVYQQPYKIP